MGPQRERPNSDISGILGWVMGTRKFTELDMIEHCGLDAYMFLDFLSKSFFLFLGFTFLAVPILIPLNSSNQLGLVGLNQFTIGNISDQKRLWAHVALTVLFCGATIALAIVSVRQYITRRQRYLMSDHHAQSLQATTILVCGIPKGEDNLLSLHSVFSVFPGGIKRIWMAYSAKKLEKDVKKRNALTNKLESAECALIRAKLKHQLKSWRRASTTSRASTDLLRNNHNNNANMQQQQIVDSDESFSAESRPHHRPVVFPMSLFASCCGAEKVDTVQAYRSELSNMNATIQARQQAGMTAMHDNHDQNKMSAAFIQFNQQLGAHLATRAVIHTKTLTMAPRHLEVHPKDVLWDNLDHSLMTRNIRRTIAMILTIALIVFWTVPVAFVSSIAKLDRIVEFAPFLSGVYSLPTFVVGIIQGIIPPIGLAILMAILPIILYKLTHLGGEVLSTRKTQVVITSYHWFSASFFHSLISSMVVHVLLVTTLANGIFAAVQRIKDNPNNIMNMLAETLPQASTFFLSFILVSFTQVPLRLLQIGPLIIYLISKKLAKTPRQVYAAERNLQSVDWGMTIPGYTIAFSIGLLYSTIQPLILPLMVIYFGLYYLVFRYMFLYVYKQPHDSGGLIFPRIVDQIYVAVVIFEIVMLGLFILQKAAGQSVVMFILFVATILTIVISRNRVFKPLIQFLPIKAFDIRAVNLAISGNAPENASIAAIASGYGVHSDSNPRGNGIDSQEAPNFDMNNQNQTNAAAFSEKINPIPQQESFHEKAPYKDSLSPTDEPESKEMYSDNSPLPSIVIENAPVPDDHEPGLTSIVTSSTSPHDRRNSLGSNFTHQSSFTSPTSASAAAARYQHQQQQQQQQRSLGHAEYGDIGASSSLQVLGANHSTLSSSDPAAEIVVPEELSYVNPALWKQGNPIWLPKDPRGFAEVEVMELDNAGLPCTTDCATMDMKGRVAVEVSQREIAPGDDYWE
ncbi:hypothetical protein BG011_009334 [Mortierella polycephala]|uniref:DUF221-domain-containing protein n=1 Tax=Mortierella polycephala TaxID=41804 RepID=A0A9P6PLI0_9FUNG|nr:hypothetical protein BG011_009334 [Mortierella polycephala]